MRNFKIISILIVSIFLLVSCGDGNGKISQNSDKNNENCFVFDKEEQSIISYRFDKEECGKNIIIPEKIDGAEVTSIGNEAFMNPHIDKLLINLKIKMRINKCSNMYDCPELIAKEMEKFYKSYKTIESVEFPQNIWWIGEKAFFGNAIRNIALPNSIHKINAKAFELTQIKEISIPEITYYGDNKENYFAFNKDTKINIVPFKGELNQDKNLQLYRDTRRINDIDTIRGVIFSYKNSKANKYPDSLSELLGEDFKEIPKEKYLNAKSINNCTFGYKYNKINDNEYTLSTCLETQDEFIYKSGSFFFYSPLSTSFEIKY